MTKKDYELIARAIKADKTAEKREREEVRAEIAYRLAVDLEMQNPRFNRELFLTACGVN